MSMLNKLTIRIKFESREVELIQNIFSNLNTSVLPADDDELSMINQVLLVLKKFETIRVMPNKHYTRTLNICDVNVLIKSGVRFGEDDAYSIVVWNTLTDKLFKELQKWKVQVLSYRAKI